MCPLAHTVSWPCPPAGLPQTRRGAWPHCLGWPLSRCSFHKTGLLSCSLDRQLMERAKTACLNFKYKKKQKILPKHDFLLTREVGLLFFMELQYWLIPLNHNNSGSYYLHRWWWYRWREGQRRRWCQLCSERHGIFLISPPGGHQWWRCWSIVRWWWSQRWNWKWRGRNHCWLQSIK